ncbi:hypothetical protein QFC19_005783 [Naganishia cerealis]|uniref:Uncharacterized protein n=1 Tax=Naganishia cerealis TaxID=610337 RepID=A0ACC2VL56_9TREE|nr:hypothetical protein QFC19_005783 [Naganishia cerealis]
MDKRFIPQVIPTKESVKPSATAFIALNIVRFLSIVALCLIFASQIVGAAIDADAFRQSRDDNITHMSTFQQDNLDCDYFEYSSVPDQPGGIFWAILNRTFILIVVLILLPTELVIPAKKLTQFYIDYIPIISPAHGLGILGVIQCWIASTALSKTPQTKAAHRVCTTYNDKFDKLKPFTDTAASTLNHMRNPTPEEPLARDNAHTSTENLLHKDTTRSHIYTEPDVDIPDVNNAESGSPKRFSKTPGIKFGGFGFGKQAAKPVGQRGLVITRPLESLPRFASEAGFKNKF